MFSSLRNLREALTPLASSNDYRQTGQLLPEEFVAAGDYLHSVLPEWSWQSGDKDKARNYLPSEKQFLIRKNLACLERADSLQSRPQEDTEDGFVNTFSSVQQESERDISDELEATNLSDTPQRSTGTRDEDTLEIDDMIVPDDDEDQDALRASIFVPKRSYDVILTYDKYYRTPRFWLHGWSESGSPLSAKEVWEDISGDHTSKTVTMEPFPHSTTGNLMASVHPCKHASTMKRFLEIETGMLTAKAEKTSRQESDLHARADERAKGSTLVESNEGLKPGALQQNSIANDQEGDDEYILMSGDDVFNQGSSIGGETRVDQYLIIFLKFMGTITPTIDHEVGLPQMY